MALDELEIVSTVYSSPRSQFYGPNGKPLKRLQLIGSRGAAQMVLAGNRRGREPVSKGE